MLMKEMQNPLEERIQKKEMIKELDDREEFAEEELEGKIVEGEEDIFCLSVARSLVGKERTKRRGGVTYLLYGRVLSTDTHTPKTLWPSLGPTGRQVPLLFVLIPFPLCREVVQPSRHHDRTNGREKEKKKIIKKNICKSFLF